MEQKLTYAVVINVIAFALYAFDKRRARRRKTRVNDNILLIVALIGGSAGAYLAMHVCHTKMHHAKFRILVPLFLSMHILGALMLI